MEDRNRPFPIQKGGTIPWWLAEIAYKYYNCKASQSLERLAERGGFGKLELVWLLQQARTTYPFSEDAEFCGKEG